MTTFDEILQAARRLSPAEQRRLREALGVAPAAGVTRAELPLASAVAPRPHSAAWVKAEQGHAVLAPSPAAPRAAIPAGPSAIAGMWADATVTAGAPETEEA